MLGVAFVDLINLKLSSQFAVAAHLFVLENILLYESPADPNWPPSLLVQPCCCKARKSENEPFHQVVSHEDG